jgi:hypothetical protein
VLRAAFDAWAALAFAAWPWGALITMLYWLTIMARTIQASPKAYATEQRIAAVETTYLPAAVQPGSSPPIAETWHDFPAGATGWGITGGSGTGWKKYRLRAEGSVEVAINMTLIGTQADNTAILAAGALPAGYRPVAGGKYLAASIDTAAASFYAANHSPYLVFRTDGSVACYGVNATGLNQLQCNGVFSTF